MALPYNSIQELTSYERNEFIFDSNADPITNPSLPEIAILLNQCGIELKEKDTYDLEFSNAVAQFQDLAGITTGLGILNTPTLHAIILTADRMMDENIEEAEVNEDGEIDDTTLESDDPHYDSFFRETNHKTFRKNKQDIRISFGSGNVVKTLKDVFIRSSSVEVDTSGNPISEVYEFVARDLIESDEPSDFDKYLNEEDVGESGTSSIKYTYDYEGYDTSGTNKGLASIEEIKEKAKSKKNINKMIKEMKKLPKLEATEIESMQLKKKKE